MASEQGWVARELARCGAQVTGLDLAPNLLALARHYEEQEPLGIGYVQGELCPGFAANAHVVAA